MAADPGPAQDAPVAIRDRVLDLVARLAAPGLERRQIPACVVDELLGGRRRRVQGLPDLEVGESAHLAKQQRGALLGGQRVQISPQLAQVLAQGRLPLDIETTLLLQAAQRVRLAPPADDVDAPVVGHPIQPGAHVHRAHGSPQLPVGAAHQPAHLRGGAARITRVQAELKAGLTGANVKDGSLARASLAPSVQTGAR